MYIFFVGLFLIYRYVERNEGRDARSLLYRAINSLEEIAEGDLERKEKNRILAKLQLVEKVESKQTVFFARKLEKLIDEVEPLEDKNESKLMQWWKKVRWSGYHKILKRRAVQYMWYMGALVFVISGIGDTVFLAQSFSQSEFEDLYYQGINLTTRSDMTLLLMKVGAEVMTSILFAGGIFLTLKGKLRRAATFFQYGLLINIFLTSVFRFYFEQFSGVFGLFMSIAAYMLVKRMAREI